MAERRPLLQRSLSSSPSLSPNPSCPDPASDDNTSNPHSDLPVYTTIHRIRRDVVAVVEDYLSLDQLRDVSVNVSLVRPLVDKYYDLDDVSVVYCLLVNRAEFLDEQAHLTSRDNVNFSRATLCELVAGRILRRFGEDNEGPRGLLLLSNILLAGFEPFQNAPEDVRREAEESSAAQHNTLPALELAILTESKLFLNSTSCQKVVDAVYVGRVIYTPSSFLNLIPDRYKKKPISLYDPRDAPLLNQYRLIVPRTRNFLEIFQFCILLALYLAFMAERVPGRLSSLEVCFTVYAFGWVLDLLATILEHGWHVYTQNLWSFLDVTFAVVYLVYLVLRIYGWCVDSLTPGQQALDVLAMGAPVLIPRLAFNLLSDNLLFVSLRSMMADFTLLSALSAWCFFGFLLSLMWLGEGRHEAVTISRWMIYIWFGLDGSGIRRSAEFHWILGPALMIAFTFLGNTLFLTILVSMLSHTFSRIVSNATAEIHFRHSVMTLEGVKSDAIFAYQPPFNILAMLVLVPLKFLVGPRWFHKIHVASVRFLNLPLLLVIALAERRNLWPTTPTLQHYHHRDTRSASAVASSSSLSPEPPASSAELRARSRTKRWFWGKLRITAHSRIEAVFDIPPPDGVLDEMDAEDDLAARTVRRPLSFFAGMPPPAPPLSRRDRGSGATPSRRDSLTMFPELGSGTGDLGRRLSALEESVARIEKLLRGGGGEE